MGQLLGLDPVADWELKISIMPTTVPNRPMQRADRHGDWSRRVKERSSSCADLPLPALSIASFMT